MPTSASELTPFGSVLRREQALLAEPFVDADSPVHALRAVVGDDEHDGVLVRVLEEAGHEAVDVAVVVEDGALVPVAGLVPPMLRIHELPEAVMHPVRPHLDHREEPPRLRREQVLGEREAPIGHLVDLAEEVVLVLGPEVLAVEDVFADRLLDLASEHGRVRVSALDRRREEAADQDAVQRPRWVGPGHAEHDRRMPRARDEIPEAGRLDRVTVRDEERVVRVVGAVAESVHAEVAGRLAGHHAGPGGHGDRRDHGGQPSVGAALHEPCDRRQLGAPALEHEGRLGAVEADDHDLGCGLVAHGRDSV